MSDRDEPRWSAQGPAVAAEVSERIRSMLADAEAAAAAIRHQAEQDAQARRRAAETDALKVVEEARREAERFLTDRIERISRLSDEILDRGQTVVERLDSADEVRSQLSELVLALGETAARLANEVRAMPGPRTVDLAHEPIRRQLAAPEPPAAETPVEESAPAEVEPEGPAAREAPAEEPEAAAAEEPRGEAEAAREPRGEPEAAEEPRSEPEAAEEQRAEPEAAEEPRSDFAAAGTEPEGPSKPEEPLREPTPLHPEPVAEAEAEDEAEAPPAEEETPAPTAEEAELIEQVKAAERERSEEAGAAVDGDGPEIPASEIVEIRATEVAAAAGPGPDQALGARLVALQMAVAGGNRGEVEAHLRRAFDLDEPGAILDDIFGSGTDSDKRVAWPEAG